MRMLRLMALLSLLCLDVGHAQAAPGDPGVPADPLASQATKNLLAHLHNLPNQSSQRLISGQWSDWNGFNAAAQARLDTIHTMTGRWVGLVGVTPWKTRVPPAPMEYTLNTSLQGLMNYWNQGGLIQVHGYFPNPSTGAGATDITFPIGTYADIYTENGNARNVRFKADLDMLAATFQQFEDADVVILFDLFNEMNRPYFWWGANSNDAQFKLLWQYTFNYLTETKGLHNLLFVYAPERESRVSVMGKYPGDLYVDVVATDTYRYQDPGRGGKIFNYGELVATGKPFAMAEFGLEGPSGTGGKDLNAAIQDVKANMPRTVYFMMWNEHWALDLQNNARTALNDPWIQNRRTPPQSIP